MRRMDISDPSERIDLQHVLIKWTGGKRRQARRIVERFPRKIAIYHEPFLGGGAVLYELLGRTDIRVDRIECGDTCVPLVELWQVVRDDPEGLLRRYAERWASLKAGGKGYYYEARHEFNAANDPYLFFFLLRTCRNGLVRFNRRGEFNTGFHGARPGMEPETVEAVLADWWRRLGRVPVRFAVRDYREVSTAPGDLLYLDPPYLNGDGQYYGGMIDFPEFFGWLRGQRGDHLLSLNGFLGDEDRTVAVPGDLLDWYGHDLCGRLPKVKDVICGDALAHLGRLGRQAKYLYDIWPRLGDAALDGKFQAAKRRLPHVWGWGDCGVVRSAGSGRRGGSKTAN